MNELRHEFVVNAPQQMESGTIYVSIKYASVLHLCACGCGSEIVTPLAPDQWALTFDGKSITLHPSVGNSSLACRSHYWIRRNRVVWCPPLDDMDVLRLRSEDEDAAAQALEDGVVEGAAPVVARWRSWLRRAFSTGRR